MLLTKIENIFLSLLMNPLSDDGPINVPPNLCVYPHLTHFNI